jgi:hypothetical protein
MGRLAKNKERTFICGRCKQPTYRTGDQDLPDVCPQCGYVHGQRDEHSVPEKVKWKFKR